MNLDEMKAFSTELVQNLRLKTYPIAVKLLLSEADIPENTIRPREHLGKHLALCQAFAMSRREETQVAMLKEDHWCYAPVIALGHGEPPNYYLEGHTGFPDRVDSIEAASRLAMNFPRTEVDKYIGIISAPLHGAAFPPDMVVIYCDSSQLRTFLQGIRYVDGYQVTSTLEPGAACVQATIPTVLSGDCSVAVPCLGDRNWALAQDDEMIFTVPATRLDALAVGLRHFWEMGSKMPAKFGMRAEYPIGGNYVKVGRMLGMDVHE